VDPRDRSGGAELQRAAALNERIQACSSRFCCPPPSRLPQTLVLAGLFVAVGLCTDTAYVMAAATLAPRLRTRLPRKPCGRYLSAATYLGLGLYAAIASPRATPPTAHAP